ncbi:MAG TPA: lipase maturation factor family protein [Vicinamibacterales bacterium]|nr:lipase maturation factor family protein [Vicinamibacterales bacterium]
MADGLAGDWWVRFVFERALALIYLIAFINAVNQYVPLVGQHGLLPAGDFIRDVPFVRSPSLFYLAHSDLTFRIASWAGVALSCVALSGIAGRAGGLAAAAVWGALWVLYLSLVNVGQTFYAFGWETLLLEAGFLAMFLGGRAAAPSVAVGWLYRWLLFRVMFGAGLIKLRGDSCWRDFTCLNSYFETQPIPNPLSWFFHHLPSGFHTAGVAVNHAVELGVPFAYFLPQPFAGIAGLVTMGFQGTLILSGNLSWLNWLTIAIAIPTLDPRWFAWLPAPPLHEPEAVHRAVTYGLVAVVALLSVNPVLNLVSAGQMMNASFEPLHLVNTYGAFGSVTRDRDEIVIQGTADTEITDQTVWREYEFKGKPGDPARRPIQIAPYHLRIDWLMWFAAMSTPNEHPWFQVLMLRLLEGDGPTLSLLGSNPFPDQPPRYVRALLYRYRFTTPDEHRRTGAWWTRELLGPYTPTIRLR